MGFSKKEEERLLGSASFFKQEYHRDSVKADWKEIEKTLRIHGFENVICDENFRCKVKAYEKRNGILKPREDMRNEQLENKLSEIDEKTIEMKKERYKLNDQRSALNKIIREEARSETIRDIIIREISNVTPYPPVSYPTYNKRDSSDVLIGLNDLHFGIDIDNYWNKYNPEIAKERLTQYLIRIKDIRDTHLSENCVVIAGGDMISGSIHLTTQLANRENIVRQIKGVSELVAWFLKELSGMFTNVAFADVPGNHSRLTMIKENAPKDERLDDLIPWYIEARLQNIKNIGIIGKKIDNTINVVNIRGLDYVAVHGDNDSMTSVLKLIEMLPEKPYGIFMGHLHHNATNFVQGFKLMMSGSLMGVDDYCIEKRIFGKPQQLVAVCDKYGVRLVYDIIF